MSGERIIRKLTHLLDVDTAALGDGKVPVWRAAVSSHQYETVAGGGVDLAASNQTYTSGTVVLSGAQNVTVGTNGQTILLSAGGGGVNVAADAHTYTSGTVVLSGGANVTVGTNGQTVTISVAAQSVQTQNQFDLTLDGNTSGVLALVSSGTLTLAGGNNVTVSQNGNAITISGPNTVAQSAQTGISSIQASDATFTSGKVIFTGVGGGVTVSSNTGQRVDISVAAPVAQSVQTQNLIAATLDGNTSGALALMSSGTITLAGGNNITLSQAGNAVTISGPNVGGAQTAISGISASDTLYTSGTVRFTGVGGGVTISSNTGQRVDISVAAQTAETAISGISASDTLYTSGTVKFTGVGGGVTVSSNTGQRVDISVAAPVAQTVQTQNLIDVTVGGNSTSAGGGFILISSGTLTLAGGNRVTLSQNGNAVTVSGAAAQTGISSIAASDATYTSGQVEFTGSNMVTVKSSANQRVVIDATQSVQTQNLIDVSLAGNSTSAGAGFILVSSGTLILAGGNNITLSQNGNSVTVSGPNTAAQTAESQSLGMSNLGNTSGTTGIASGAQVRYLLAGGNNVTLSQSLNGASGTVTISAAAQTVESQSLGISNLGNTSGTSGIASGGQVRYLFAGGNNITLSQSVNGASGTVTISAFTQTVQTQNMVALSVTNTLYSSGTVVITGSNMITVKSSAAGQTIILDATQSNQSAIKALGVSNTGNTAGNTGVSTGIDWVIAGTNGVTVSESTAGGGPNTIWLSAGGGAGLTAGVSTGGNTSGDTTAVTGRLILAGGNNITLSGSSNAGSMTITISAPNLGAGAMSAGVSNLGNTAGATGITGTQMVLVGTGPVSLSQTTGANGGTVSINAPATSLISGTGQVSISTNGSTVSIGAPNPIMSFYRPAMPLLMTVTQGIGASGAAPNTTVTAWVMPMSLPADLQFNNINLAANVQISTATTSISSVNFSFSMGASLGFYTLNVSTMSLVTSFSGSLGLTNATSANATDLKVTARVGMGGSSTTKDITGAANMSAIMSSISGVRQIPLNWSTLSHTLTRGQYFVVAAFSALTAGANQASLSQVGYESSHASLGSIYNPPELMQNTASVTSPYPFLGQATLVHDPTSLMLASFNTSKITTATAIANSTKFQSLWMRIYSSHSH